MTIEAVSAAPPRVARKPGRLFFWTGIALGILGPVLYMVQLMGFKLTTVPWYLLAFAGGSLLLLLAALVQARSVWQFVARFVALGVFGVVPSLMVFFILFMTKLPDYTGPVARENIFPPFETTQWDGKPFTDKSLQGDQNTVMVFFRGRW